MTLVYLGEKNIPGILDLANRKHGQEIYTKEQILSFVGNVNKGNISVGYSINNRLSAYIIAFKESGKIKIHDFAWEKPKQFMNFFKEYLVHVGTADIEVYMCDQGLRIFSRFINNGCTVEIIKTEKCIRYGETVNKLVIRSTN